MTSGKRILLSKSASFDFGTPIALRRLSAIASRGRHAKVSTGRRSLAASGSLARPRPNTEYSAAISLGFHRESSVLIYREKRNRDPRGRESRIHQADCRRDPESRTPVRLFHFACITSRHCIDSIQFQRRLHAVLKVELRRVSGCFRRSVRLDLGRNGFRREYFPCGTR